MKTINTLMKEIEEDANKLKDIPKKIDIVKISILLKAIYRFNAISLKFLRLLTI